MSSVLIVDDEPGVRNLMARWVSGMGLDARTAASADEALAALQTQRCDVAVIDVMMPGRDGIWLTRQLTRDHPDTAVVLASGYSALFEDGSDPPRVADFLMKPVARDRFVLAMDRGRQWRKAAQAEVRWHAQLLREVHERTEAACFGIRRHGRAGAGELDLLLAMAQARTPDVLAHSERVAGSALTVAPLVGVDEAQRPALESAARFHDIGKMTIPDALLQKPSALTPGERAVMRRHVETGAKILAATNSLHTLAPIVLASHEWFAGGGYPLKLAGDAIPLASRIIAVVDAYDAMTEHRSYRVRLDSSDAVAELLRCAGTQFDPHVVTAFLAVLKQN